MPMSCWPHGFSETGREGFERGTVLGHPVNFVTFFCSSHKGCRPDSHVTRIEYEYI